MSSEPDYDIELTHEFDASRERIYRAFTDRDEFARLVSRCSEIRSKSIPASEVF